ncbi:MAG: hypothetical protein ACI9U2_003916 [Bradymonadia bacterium]|jgi:hypothetical protein
MTRRLVLRPVTLLTALIAFAACDDATDDATEDAPSRAHELTVYGEDFVEDHIPADESDGWRIEFARLVVIVQAVQAGDDGLPGTYAVELTADSGGVGHAIGVLANGPYARLDYRIAPASAASASALTAINITDPDLAPMLAAGHSIWLQGEARKGDVVKTFDWGFDTDTTYSNCETAPAEVDAKTVRSTLTIHADHFFFDDLVSDEPAVAFEQIALADADDDGVVTLDELAAVDITGFANYQVGSRDDVTDLRAFIEAQSTQLGHIDGEGHCD